MLIMDESMMEELANKMFPKNDDYYKRCEDIRYELSRGFLAIQVLKAFHSFEDDEFNNEDDRFLIMEYLLEMAKIDLALVICKVFDLKYPYYDKKNHQLIDSNTIKSLTNYLSNKGYKTEKPRLTSDSYDLYLQLKEIRNKFLAHLDINRDLRILTIEQMISCFYEIVCLYNQRCIKDIDYRVIEFTMQETSDLPERVKHGLQLILDDFKAKGNEGTENAGQ